LRASPLPAPASGRSTRCWGGSAGAWSWRPCARGRRISSHSSRGANGRRHRSCRPSPVATQADPENDMADLIPLDYATLRLIWWALLGLLLLGFAVMGGFDLGIGALLPFVARTDQERRLVVNTVGPTWEGNQVWLIVGAASAFAAFPPLYAV